MPYGMKPKKAWNHLTNLLDYTIAPLIVTNKQIGVIEREDNSIIRMLKDN